MRNPAPAAAPAAAAAAAVEIMATAVIEEQDLGGVMGP